jgi:hypothetical protein
VNLEIALDRLHFTLTAPPAINPASSFVVTLWVHLESQRAVVVHRACQQYRASDMAGLMSVSKGPVRIARGTILVVRLMVSGATIEDPEESVLWDGEIGCANFVVTLPTNREQQTLPDNAIIYLNDVQIAKVQFVLRVGTAPADSTVPIRRPELAEHSHHTLPLIGMRSWGGYKESGRQLRIWIFSSMSSLFGPDRAERAKSKN